MDKLKYFSMNKIEELPDYLVNETRTLTEKMEQALLPLIGNADPNVVLGALNSIHATMIRHLVVDNPEELQKAAKLEALSFLKNVELLSQGTSSEFSWDKKKE